tara:strand:- start:664 stop:1269 length:606 start_codon:yes stop_codon:yes gene_type:complete
MSIEVQFRRGSESDHSSFTGANGEITVDTTNKTIRVHDGVTSSGFRLARYDELGASANLQSYAADIVPSANNVYDLGSSEKVWAQVHSSEVDTDQLKLSTNEYSVILQSTANTRITAINPANTSQSIPVDFEDVSVTNLVLRTVLGTQYGGTGLSSFTENGVMYAVNTSILGFITGSTGQIMQIGSDGVPTFDVLDGGDFV